MPAQKNQGLTAKQIDERIRKVNGAMALENMPLTQADKEMLKSCLSGKSTHEIERQKIIRKYKAGKGVKHE